MKQNTRTLALEASKAGSGAGFHKLHSHIQERSLTTPQHRSVTLNYNSTTELYTLP